jgi:hypothetical protein
MLCKNVREASGFTVRKKDPQHAALVEAIKDIQELWFILEKLGDRLLSAPFVDRLQDAMKDSMLANASGDNTPGRDRQFELFLAAIATRAGFLVEEFAPVSADWKLTLSTPSACYSLEAKRLKSQSKIESRVGEAADQIRRSRVGGIIVLDISRAANPQGGELESFIPNEALDRIQQNRGESIRRELLPRLQRAIGDAPVGLLILHEFVTRPGGESESERHPWGLHGLWYSYSLKPEDSDLGRRYAMFDSLFSRAMPDL